MEWIFSGIGTAIVSAIVSSGIGTAIVSAIVSFVLGVIGGRKYQENVYKSKDEFDIGRVANMSNFEIEKVIRKGNDATVRKWCRELILEKKQEYLINMCIEKMTNDQEKYKLLKELADREVASTKYRRLIENSITNNVNLFKLIELYLSLGLADNVALIFRRMNNNTYILKSLKLIYPIDRNLFNSLYENGSCFNNDKYIKEMEEWISAQCEKSL